MKKKLATQDNSKQIKDFLWRQIFGRLRWVLMDFIYFKLFWVFTNSYVESKTARN